MVAARCKDTPLYIASHHSSYRDIQSFTTHMLADSHELALSNLLLDLVYRPSKPTFLYCCLRHCGRQMGEIEVADIAFVSLEVRIVPEEFIEFVSPRFSFKENILTVFLELFFYLCGYCE
jgi:hypothetical protein